MWRPTLITRADGALIVIPPSWSSKASNPTQAAGRRARDAGDLLGLSLGEGNHQVDHELGVVQGHRPPPLGRARDRRSRASSATATCIAGSPTRIGSIR